MRQTSAVFAPASCSFSIPMIYTSVNREEGIVRVHVGGRYLNLGEVQGLRSWEAIAIGVALPLATLGGLPYRMHSPRHHFKRSDDGIMRAVLARFGVI